MKNTQFVHLRNYDTMFVPMDDEGTMYTEESFLSPYGGETIAMKQVDVDTYYNLNEGDFLHISVGKAKCSYQDRYEKSIGRELAVTRMKTLELFCSTIEEDEMSRHMCLLDKDNNRYFLRLTVNSERVQFISYEESYE